MARDWPSTADFRLCFYDTSRQKQTQVIFSLEEYAVTEARCELLFPFLGSEELALPRFQVDQKQPSQSGTPGMLRSLAEKLCMLASAWYYSSKILCLLIGSKKSQCHARNNNEPQEHLLNW